VAVRGERVRVDPSVAAAQAKALAAVDGVPLVLVNRFGKGTAALLNFQLPQRAKEATQARLGGYDLLRALYAAAGTKPPVSVAAPDGGPLPFGEARAWRNAEATVFGIWHQLNIGFFAKKPKWDEVPPLRAKATLPEPLYVYDLRRHKALGRTREVGTAVAISQANFFLAAPYELKAPKLTLSSATPPRGSKLAVAISLGLPDSAKAVHAVRVEVLDPSGKATIWGGSTVLLPGGRGQLELPIAHDDAPGRWRVQARELFSGASAEAHWLLK
jgi:hypothetical protein